MGFKLRRSFQERDERLVVVVFGSFEVGSVVSLSLELILSFCLEGMFGWVMMRKYRCYSG